jgi:ketosteroid isomerase-like protein
MKQGLGLAGVVSVVCLAVVVSAPLQAQEWSAAQQDVWKSVEAYWALDAKGDIEGFMSYVDASYIGWSYDSPVPGDKATMKKFITQEYQLYKTLLYDIKPVAIQVHGNFAFADYYYTLIMKNTEGKTEDMKGRWTDILMKQGDRWVMIGDHGGRIKGS